jgi:hypothetical protein
MKNRDDRILSRAITQRWPIESKWKEAIVGRMLAIIGDKSSSNREIISAVKALISAEKQNQTDEHTAALQSDRNRFLEVAQQLGIDADFRLVGQEPAGANHVGTDGPKRFDEATVERHRAQADDEEQSG